MLKSSGILFICFFFVLGVFAQNEKENVKKDFIIYNKLLKDKKFKASLEYVNPDFFNYFPKEELLKGMEQTTQNESLIYQLLNPVIKEIHPVFTYQDKQFTVIDYNSDFNIKLKDVDSYSKDKLEAYKKYYGSVFEKSFGKENVIFNPKTKFFEIKSHNFAIASSDKGKNEWKFLQIDPNLGDVYRKIFPAEVLDKLDIIKNKK